MEWLEISASSVKSAKEQALIHLGVHESDAEFEVLAEERLGMFGRVRQEARVRARVVPTPVRPKEVRGRGHGSRKTGSGSSKRSSAAPQEPKPNAREGRRSPNSPASNPKPSARNRGDDARNARHQRAVANDNKSDSRNDKRNEEPMMEHDTGPSLLEQADLAESFVRGVADTLSIPLVFTRHDVQDGILRIEADGEGVGPLVGRRGTTAQAIDELVRTVLQRSGGSTREGKIRMDVGGIRARRAAALTEFTRKVAQDVIESGQEIALEPMNRLDRKIIHDAVSTLEQVESRSEGVDPHRRVVIAALSD